MDEYDEIRNRVRDDFEETINRARTEWAELENDLKTESLQRNIQIAIDLAADQQQASRG